MYSEQIKSELSRKELEHFFDIVKNPEKGINDFEKELGIALKEYISAENNQDEELRNKLYHSFLKHAQKAKKDKDCIGPYSVILDGLIDKIQNIINNKE